MASPAPDPSGHTVIRTSLGSLVHVEAAGEGPSVLALHGVGGGAYFFRGLAARFDSPHRVFATDLPGTGFSTAATPVSIDSWVSDIIDVVDRLIGTPVIVVGHSLGTILALKLSSKRPDLVRGLAFVGGLPEPRAAVRERLRARIADVRANGMAGWGARVSAGVFGPRAFAERVEVIGLFERLLEAHDPESYLRSLELLIGANAWSAVPEVSAPWVSISGSDDQYAPPEDVAAFVSRLPGKGAHVVMPGIGHMPFFEDPAAFARHLDAFFSGLESSIS